MGSKSPSQTSNSSYAPSDQASGALNYALNKARKAASTPYQAYSGELVAGINSQEQGAIDATNLLQGATDGYLGQAGGYAQGSTSAVDPTALDGAAISKYMDPYRQNVIDSTLATINNQNRQEAEGLTSGLISQGAFGGDRAGVAQAALAGQQDLAKTKTIADLNSQNYSQALATAQQQQQTKLGADQANRQALATGAQLFQGLGSTASSTGIANANAQMQAGLLQQQTQQAQNEAAYGQFMQRQAYPFQTSQFLTGATGSLAPQLGGTTDGYAEQSAPNIWNSIIGGGLGLASIFAPAKKAAGGRVRHIGDLGPQGNQDDAPLTLGDLGRIIDLHHERERRARGGRTLGDVGEALRFADGGMASMPYADAPSYVPTANLGNLGGHPQSPSLGNMPSMQPANDPGTANLAAGVKLFGDSSMGKSVGSDIRSGLGLARGGGVRGYDGGGVVPGADALTFDPGALGTVPPQGMSPGLGSLIPSEQPSLGTLGRSLAPPAPTKTIADLSPAPAAPTPTKTLADLSTPVPSPTKTLGDVGQARVPVAPAPDVTPVVGYKTIGDLGTPSPEANSGLGAINRATAPRSVRNNNPGNIVDGKYAQGLPGYAGSDGRFAKFDTTENGTSAMDGLLSSYGRQGLTTPLQIISKWAPAGDGNNDPKAYATTVAQKLGIGVNDPIDMTDPTQRAALGKAMAGVEAGTGGSGRLPSSVSAYAGGSDGGGTQGGVTPTDGTRTLASAGSPGVLDKFGLGGLQERLGLGDFGLTNDQRMGLMGMAAGTMASNSRNLGQALGEGGLKGAEAMQGQQKIQNEAERVRIAAEELHMNIQKTAGLLKNYESEDTFRKGSISNESNRISLERYELIPGPDGAFRYLDKLNPSAGLLTAEQMPPGVLPPQGGGAAPAGAPHPTGTGNPPPTGAPSPASAPSPAAPAGRPPMGQAQPQVPLDSSGFVKTGNPTLKAPDGYLPTNYWTNVYRAKNDPVMRETLARQSVEDVADANKRATKAYSGLYYSDEMDRAIAGLPQSGALAPGSFFNERLNLAKHWNAIAGSVPGMAGMKADEDAVARGESLIKDKTRLTGDLTATLGSREAASVYSSIMTSVPGGDNTRAGYKAVSSAIRTLSQREIDRNAFLQDWSARYGNTNGAEVAFNQLNPAMNYARQAEAIARIPQPWIDRLRSNLDNPRTIPIFESTFGKGTARYFTGQFAK